MNASRKAGSVAASRCVSADCPAGVRRGAFLNQANPAAAMAAIKRTVVARVSRTLRRRTAG